jgi:hypothetical protein
VAEEKQYVSRIRLMDGTTVDIKDQEARALLESLFADTIILDCGTYLEDDGETIIE